MDWILKMVFGRKNNKVGDTWTTEELADNLSGPYITPHYLNELAKTKSLHDDPRIQAGNFAELLEEHPKNEHKIEKYIFTAHEDWLLSVDGYGLPEKYTVDNYDNMIKNPKEHLYPWFVISFLNIVAKLQNKEFNWWDITEENLVSGELSEEIIASQLDFWDNASILGSAFDILNVVWSIPFGKTYEWKILCATSLVEGEVEFNFEDAKGIKDDILVPVKRFPTTENNTMVDSA